MFSRMAMASLLVAAGAAAKAQSHDSAYTRIDDTCTRHELTDGPGVETICRGHGDWTIHVAAGEHGAAVAYRRDGETMSGYASPPMRGLYGGFNDVIEWRLREGEAFATIHRYVHYNPPELLEVSGGIEEPHTLVVMALDPRDGDTACPVAFIDASALGDANQVARDAADLMAGDWPCKRAPVVFDASNSDVRAFLARGGR